MAYYNCVKQHIDEKIDTPEEFEDKFTLMCVGLGIKVTNDDGSFKTMNEYLNDIAARYLTYKREVEGMKFF